LTTPPAAVLSRELNSLNRFSIEAAAGFELLLASSCGTGLATFLDSLVDARALTPTDGLTVAVLPSTLRDLPLVIGDSGLCALFCQTRSTSVHHHHNSL